MLKQKKKPVKSGSEEKPKVYVIDWTTNESYIKMFREMVNDGLAYEAPKNHIHIIYPLEEMNQWEKIDPASLLRLERGGGDKEKNAV